MMRIALYLSAIVALQNFCSAEVTKLPTDIQKTLGDVSHFQKLHGAKNLPPTIFRLCADYNGRLAEPGHSWEATDVITNEKLPTRRLIWAVTDGNYWVVHYEVGGLGHSYHFLIARLTHNRDIAAFVWYGIGERLKDYSAFLTALKNDKLDDRFEYGH